MDPVVHEDVSRQPRLARRPVATRPVREPLVALGFRTVGYVRVRSAHPEAVPDTLAFEGADGRELARMRRDGHVHEVLSAPDGLCFAEPDWAFGARGLRLVTRLEDGTLIETRLRRARSPQVDTVGWATLDELVAWLRLDPDLLAAEHPLGGLYSERFAATPAAAWGRHCQRVEHFVAERGTRPAEHRSVDAYVDLVQRIGRVRRTYAAVAVYSFWAVWGSLALVGGAAALLLLGSGAQAVLLVALWLALLAATQAQALVAWSRGAGPKVAAALPLPWRRLRRRTVRPSPPPP